MSHVDRSIEGVAKTVAAVLGNQKYDRDRFTAGGLTTLEALATSAPDVAIDGFDAARLARLRSQAKPSCSSRSARRGSCTDAFPNADAYQMLAYCTALELREGTPIYARDEQERTDRDHTVVNAGVRVRVRTVDVSRSPAEVMRQIEELAGDLCAASARA